MSEYIHLIGAEQVQSAGNAMRNAADEMKQVAISIEDSLFRQRVFLEDWLIRFQAALDGKK